MLWAPRLFLGVHSCPDSWAIIAGTQLAMAGRWVLGPKNPATHAFAVVLHPDGLAYRLDGQPPVSAWEPCEMGRWRYPTALWEVLPPYDVEAGIARARALKHVPYDPTEIAGAVADIVGTLLPFHARITQRARWSSTGDVLRGAMICTRVVLEIERACGVGHDDLHALLPEDVAQNLRGLEDEGGVRRWQP